MMGGSSQEEGPDANGAGARDDDKNDGISSDHTAGGKNNGGNDTGRSMSSGQMAEDSSNNTNENDGDNTLWDQMTAREGRDDARRAGMRTGDWQAEMQLQEALRESRQEADPPGVASVPSTANSVAEEERSFVDAGFHALATSAVSPHRYRRRAARRGRDASTTAAENDHVDDKSAKIGIGSAGRPGADREGGDDEDDFDDVELIVTQDGGIIPVRKSGIGKGTTKMPLPPDIVLTLPDDVLHRTMLFLHPEDILECRAVSSRWEFPGDEAVFEGLCRRTYLAQVCVCAPLRSAKKLLNVDRWRSWQRMFKFRPRLRDTGLYSLKTTYFKKPVRDIAPIDRSGLCWRVTYYRYFRFFGDGRVAYGLTHESPKEFVRMLQEGSPKVVYGTYTISKWEVNVEIPNPWSWVNFTLQLANGERGRFTHLVMLRHSSVPRNDTRVGRCNHKVKSSDFFTFRRVWQF
ncbi:unnamed protein product [Scytosiphon promiscuus]